MFGRFSLVLICISAAFRLVVAEDFKHDYEAYNNARFGVYPDNRYKGTNMKSPLLQVNSWEKDFMSKSGSHLFLRHNGRQEVWGNQQASPLILDAEDLTAVYLNRTFPVVFNVRVQENFGQKYLTFYGDKLVAQGLGDGYCHIYDSSYREVYKVGALGLKTKADLHECELTGHGTVILSAYEPGRSRSPPGLTGAHKPTTIRESIFQEIELETNKVLFTWRASEHVDIYDSFENHNNVWDYFHINTIQKHNGNYLVSGRHMHSIYLVDGKTGDILWTLGGAKNEFVELAPENGTQFSNPALSFAWQHHTRFYPSANSNNTDGRSIDLTFFDNHWSNFSEAGCTADCSRGLHIRLDTESNPKTIQLVQEYLHPAGLVSQSQGSMQILDNGNVFIGWGRMPGFTEHTADGRAVFDVQFSPWISKATAGHALDNYRAFKQDWKATPYWPPTIAVKTLRKESTAYLSWNGATEVKGWVLYAGDSEDHLVGADNIVARLPRSGFETDVPINGFNATYLRAEALDKKNRVLASTGIMEVKTAKFVSMETAIINEIVDEEDKDESEAATTGDESQDTLAALNFSHQEDWQTALMMFTIFGSGLSACCIAYAMVLRYRHSRGEQQYSSL